MQRTCNLFMYDYVVCFYVFGLVFEVIWMSLGLNMENNEPSYSPCLVLNNGIVCKTHQINLYALMIFLLDGILVFILSLIIYACDEGSCNSCSDIYCLLIICCFSCCPTKKPQRDQKYLE